MSENRIKTADDYWIEWGNIIAGWDSFSIAQHAWDEAMNAHPDDKRKIIPSDPYRKGDYILNHYDRNSHKDKVVLARHLHEWALEYAEKHKKSDIVDCDHENCESVMLCLGCGWFE